MNPLPQIELSSVDDVIVAKLSGEIDGSNVTAITATCIRGVPPEVVGLIVDLSDVRYMDSAGIQMLFQFVRQLATKRQGLAIVLGAASPVRRLIKITNLDNVATCCEAVEECAASLRAQASERY